MKEEKIVIPKHICVIMDGNGRWAKKRFMPRIMGHKKGAEVFKKISKHCAESGVKYFTAYAFSTENWNRSKDEVDGIKNILRDYLKDFFVHPEDYTGYKIKFIGDKSAFEDDIVDMMNQIEKDSYSCKKLNVNIAVNYGSRQEILRAVKQILKEKEEGKIKIEDIDIYTISDHLYTKNQPDPDLVIRTSGEFRISNFLLWQSAYTEYIFTDVLWPDFTTDHFDKAIIEFGKRQRRYGGV